ncbi:MAG: ABC transporter substrate-binding protein [Myxococcota bacterium]|nr:ABC transporter substrate-binding protein [Myxococcota bacterium]
MRTRIGVLVAVGVSALLLSRCSLIVGDLQECELPSDCPQDRTCSQGFCIRVPVGCRGNPDAGVLAVYGEGEGTNTIPIGAALSLTDTAGNPSDIDLQELNALVLALEEINDRGVGNGRRFALHVCDYAANAEANVPDITRYLTDRVGVPAMIVANSSGVLRAAQETQPRDVLLISPNATSNEITALDNPDGGARLVWRTAPSDSIQGEVITELLLGQSSFDAGVAGTGKVGIAYVNDAYGQGLKDIIFGGLLGQREVQAAQFEREGDVSGAVSQLDTFNPDLTVLIGFPGDVQRLITLAASSANLSRAAPHQWFFTDAAKDPALDDGITPPTEIEGNYGTAPAKGAGVAYFSFRSSFLSRFGVDANTYAFVEHDYDLMYALALATAHAVGPNGQGPLTGTTLSAGLARLSDLGSSSFQVGPSSFTNARTALEGGALINLEGASGKLQFDPATGEAPSPIELWQFRAGVIEKVEVLEPQ